MPSSSNRDAFCVFNLLRYKIGECECDVQMRVEIVR